MVIHTSLSSHTDALQMKDWLMEHGHEADVWALVQKKGKKSDFETLVRRVTGQ